MLKILVVTYRYLAAFIIGAVWFGVSLPWLLGARSDVVPLLCFLSIPAVLAIMGLLTVPPLVALYKKHISDEG